MQTVTETEDLLTVPVPSSQNRDLVVSYEGNATIHV
jgi:hypothetical protein